MVKINNETNDKYYFSEINYIHDKYFENEQFSVMDLNGLLDPLSDNYFLDLIENNIKNGLGFSVIIIKLENGKLLPVEGYNFIASYLYSGDWDFKKFPIKSSEVYFLDPDYDRENQKTFHKVTWCNFLEECTNLQEFQIISNKLSNILAYIEGNNLQLDKAEKVENWCAIAAYYNNQAEIDKRIDYRERALYWYMLAYNEDPSNINILVNITLVHLRLKNFTEANNFYKKILCTQWMIDFKKNIENRTLISFSHNDNKLLGIIGGLGVSLDNVARKINLDLRVEEYVSDTSEDEVEETQGWCDLSNIVLDDINNNKNKSIKEKFLKSGITVKFPNPPSDKLFFTEPPPIKNFYLKALQEDNLILPPSFSLR